MRVHLQYGTDGLETELPDGDVTVLAPRVVDGVPDEAAAFRAAVARPMGVPPLASLVRPGERVVVSGQFRLTQGVRVKVSGPQMGAAG